MYSLDRRRLLLQLGALPVGLGVAAGNAWAIGERSQVSIGQLQHGSSWDIAPEALRRLLWEVKRRTSIHTSPDAKPLRIADDEIFLQPLLVLMGRGTLPALDERERARLERHLRFGGMLWIDAPSADDGFAKDAQAFLGSLLPSVAPAPLPRDHVLFKSFFLCDGAVGRHDSAREVPALSLEGRAVALLTQCDVFGALDRDRIGTWRHECVPGGERQRERAFRFAVNIVMYATCLDYKADQVHIPFIMKKSRR
ncbi:MAG: DUF4159 domain-containing protein [Myxococcota bacterium]